MFGTKSRPRGVTLAGLTLAALIGFAATAAAKEKLTVYTALEEEQLPVYKQAFEAANPNYEIEWVRDSTGVVTARLLAEKANPQADAIWGLAATSLMVGGPSRFADLLARLEVRCALLVTEENEMIVTAAMEQRIELRREPVRLGQALGPPGSCS